MKPDVLKNLRDIYGVFSLMSELLEAPFDCDEESPARFPAA